jgi:hypothetical protein
MKSDERDHWYICAGKLIPYSKHAHALPPNHVLGKGKSLLSIAHALPPNHVLEKGKSLSSIAHALPPNHVLGKGKSLYALSENRFPSPIDCSLCLERGEKHTAKSIATFWKNEQKVSNMFVEL